MAKAQTTRKSSAQTTKRSGGRAVPKPRKALPTNTLSNVKNARAEYNALLSTMIAARRSETGGWDRYWETVGIVLAKKFYILDNDTPTADTWLAKHTGETFRSGYRNVRVAEAASPDEEATYGITKIDLALTYRDQQDAVKAKSKGLPWKPANPPAPIALERCKFEIVRKGKKVSLSLKQITTDELRGLVYARDSRKQEHKMGATGTAVVAAFAASELKDVAVHERDSSITIGPFRADQVRTVGRALAAVDASESESKPKRSAKSGSKKKRK